MGVAQPSEINAAFADGFNRRDVDALLALYHADAAVVEVDGTVSHGTDPIRDHLERLITLGGTMTSTNLTSVITGEIALVTAAWEIVGASAAPTISGRSAEVLRLGEDSTWAYLIDQPA
jgi:ketosteroid isomerase-like protein